MRSSRPSATLKNQTSSTSIDRPVAATPSHSPRFVPRQRHLATTVTPSTTSSTIS